MSNFYISIYKNDNVFDDQFKCDEQISIMFYAKRDKYLSSKRNKMGIF